MNPRERTGFAELSVKWRIGSPLLVNQQPATSNSSKQKRALLQALIYITSRSSSVPCTLRPAPLPKRFIPERTLERGIIALFTTTGCVPWIRVRRSSHHNQRYTVIKFNAVYLGFYISFFENHFLLREFNFNQLKLAKYVTNVSFYLKLANLLPVCGTGFAVTGDCTRYIIHHPPHASYRIPHTSHRLPDHHLPHISHYTGSYFNHIHPLRPRNCNLHQRVFAEFGITQIADSLPCKIHNFHRSNFAFPYI